MRSYVRMKELKKVCEACGRRYAFDSNGYRKTEKCMCGGNLLKEWR